LWEAGKYLSCEEKKRMTKFIILPGIGGSGERHWQTLWEMNTSHMRRFDPQSWDAPYLNDWCNALDRAVTDIGEQPVLVAHSLACLLVAHWSARSDLSVLGAFLVSVPDPASADFPKTEAASFMDAPSKRLRFRSMLVASSNDPYGSLTYQQARATEWGSHFVEIGACGHINATSGVGEWPAGRHLLNQCVEDLVANA
jgi:predicted alpha/beta hydrolase family esterase